MTRLALPLALIAATFAAGAASAHAAPPLHGLTPLGCLMDFGTTTAGCGGTAEGIGFAFDVALSPNGQQAYVAGRGDDSVATFSRQANGTLTPTGCISSLSIPGCTTAAGLNSA